MFEGIKEILNGASLQIDESGEPTSHDVRVAVVVLLYSMADADGSIDSSEIGALCTSMLRQAGLDDNETGELMEIAQFLVADKTKLSSFTDLLSKKLNLDQKQLLMSVLWRVILADKQIDKLEGQMAAQIRTLLGLSLEQGVRARKLAEMEQVDALISKFCSGNS